jgi:hypothetical protein
MEKKYSFLTRAIVLLDQGNPSIEVATRVATIEP